jgi:putative transposase
VNFRQGWRGHLWQGRFASFVMDEPYLLAAARYVELNPVRAKLVLAPSQYRWSSARAHLKGKDDGLVRVAPLLELAGGWRRLLTSALSEEQLQEFRQHERTGRVLGDEEFQRRLEKQLGRVLRRQKPGPKKASKP